jgi:DUF4097 and DUF4098 domain-containing protein YvlB
MARNQTRSGGLFSGLVLISVGVLLLLHNYGRLDINEFFHRWWPLLIIFWGVVKLYERTVGQQFGGSDGGGITGGEVFLVLAMLALLGAVVGIDVGKKKLDNLGVDINMGDRHSFDLDVPAQKIPSNARVSVQVGRGDLNIRSSDDAEIRVSGKKQISAWSDSEADRLGKPVDVSIKKNGDAYEVRGTGYDLSDSHVSMDLEIVVPHKSPVMAKSEKGDVTVSDIGADVNISNKNGDVEVRNTAGDVSVEMAKGDVKVDDTKGDVKISGKGGEIEVNDNSGNLTVSGDFYGPIRADKVDKGVRLLLPKMDLTLSSLAGHMEAGSGNLDLVDVPGNVTLRTRDSEVSLENPGGKVDIDNRNAEINVRFAAGPKDDVQIVNSSAGISLTLPGSSNFEITADCHNCDISSEFPGLNVTKSEAGDSHLAGKFGTARGPKITLKTSYGNISLLRTAMGVPMGAPRPPAPLKAPRMPDQPLPPPEEQ